MSARSEIKNLQTSQFGNIPTVAGDTDTAKDAVGAMHRREYIWQKEADDGAASTATAEFPFAHVRRKSRVKNITVACDATALAADNTDYVTITVAKRTAAGSAVTLGTYDSRAANQGALTAFVPVEFALTAANLGLAAGDVLTGAVAKAGSGKVLPAGCITVDVEEE